MWTDINEGLPTKEGKYLCILDVGLLRRPVDSEPFYHICHFYPEDKHWHHRRVFKEVTHWMSLPEMPEETE